MKVTTPDKHRRPAAAAALVLGLWSAQAGAHDPVFGPGPHVLYKGGLEVHLGAHRDVGGGSESEFELEIAYGVTGDWAVGMALPWTTSAPADEATGFAGPALFTKYRFWRRDTRGAQTSAALFAKRVTDAGADSALHAGDAWIGGLAYGYESLDWYRWAAVRYRRSETNDEGARPGDRLLVDAVLGYRFEPPRYREPDAVWMLELNGEFIESARAGGRTLPDTGSDVLFLSPGLMWTYRNFAFKGGVQLPVWQDRHGLQDEIDYRAKLETEWHF